jgi:hypothetical protein
VFRQLRPRIDQASQVRRQFGPVCATSVQPQPLFGYNFLDCFTLRLDVLGLSIRWLRVRVPSPSLNRSSRRPRTCGYCRFRVERYTHQPQQKPINFEVLLAIPPLFPAVQQEASEAAPRTSALARQRCGMAFAIHFRSGSGSASR